MYREFRVLGVSTKLEKEKFFEEWLVRFEI